MAQNLKDPICPKCGFELSKEEVEMEILSENHIFIVLEELAFHNFFQYNCTNKNCQWSTINE